jgi:phage anti-repressor protein
MIEKLKTSFVEEEQRWYIANLYMYINYHPTNDFPINLEDVYKLIGFAHKKNAKRTLENNFILNEDYKILLLPTEKQVKTNGGAGLNKEEILLNVDTFKNLCMLTKSEESKKIRKYYVKLETIYNELVMEEKKEYERQKEESMKQLEEQQKQLEEKNKQIEELQLSKNKTYEEVEKTGHIYVIKTDAQGAYKIGKTKDAVTKRVKGLQTGNVNNIEILLDFPTSNADLLERCVHYILNRYRCNSNREYFDCNFDYIKLVIEISCITIDTLKSTFKCIPKEEFNQRLQEALKNNIDYIVRNRNIQKEPDKQTISNNKTDFFNWLEQHIEYKRNGVLQVNDICKLYLDKHENMHSTEVFKYKQEIQEFIKEKHPTLRWEYSAIRVNGKTYKGWKNLGIRLQSNFNNL